jgi:hypothetical protein
MRHARLYHMGPVISKQKGQYVARDMALIVHLTQQFCILVYYLME